jgi:hypothetical protein
VSQDNGSPDFEKSEVNLKVSELPKILNEIDRLSDLIAERLNVWLKILTSSVRTLPLIWLS